MALKPYLPDEPAAPADAVRELVETLARELREEGAVNYAQAERILQVAELDRRELAARLGVDPRTLGRFRERGRLSPAASDRLYRLAKLLQAASELHGGDVKRALRWLKAPNRALGSRRPLEMVDFEPEFERVMDLVGALEEGVFV